MVGDNSHSIMSYGDFPQDKSYHLYLLLRAQLLLATKYLIPAFYYIVDVEMHWHHRDLITISPIRKEDFGFRGLAQYEVSAFTVFDVTQL